MGFTEGGLPLSLQLAARPFEEALLVRTGDAFQQATDWHLRVPPLITDLVATGADA
jgi:aspartyl-tRNA(Asn)/glutamyl-tRNA(Gln) amidotransferase subunit A